MRAISIGFTSRVTRLATLVLVWMIFVAVLLDTRTAHAAELGVEDRSALEAELRGDT